MSHSDSSIESTDELEARRHVRRLRSFYQHLLVFLLVNSGLAAINLLTHPGRLWFIWPLAGWALWLGLHGLALLARGRYLGSAWEERKVQKYLLTQKSRSLP